ncbi:MAG: insulinase family protein, partial [Gammaproteobacteria bacterium]|nr:insulinase family protein [Gammaproteobacteria bacterium]
MYAARFLITFIATAGLISCGQQNDIPQTAGDADAKSAQDAPGDIFDMPYLMRDLDNGLRVVIVKTDYPDVVTIQIPVQTGARNEIEKGKSGFAHFFEHMMFRGTEKYPPDVYRSILQNAGADQNAYTSDDLTNYHITFTKADLEKVIELEADRFKNLSYTEDQFRTEALAVKGEYLKNSTNPVWKIFERMRDISFDTHTYEHSPIGFVEDIDMMPEQMEYSKIFFDRWYRPEKSVVILVGDLDPEKTFALVEKYWSDWERGTHSITIPQEGPPTGPKYEHYKWASPTAPWVVFAFRGPAFNPDEKDMPAMDLISQLYFSQTSALFQKLVIEEQVLDSLQTFFPDRKDPGLLMIFARLSKQENTAADSKYVSEEIIRTVAEARTGLIDAEKLTNTKSYLKYNFAAGLDNSDAIGSTLASYGHFSRTPIETMNKVYRRYDALTAEDIRDYANQFFIDASRVVFTLSHDDELAGMDTLSSIDEMVAATGMQAAEGATQPDVFNNDAFREDIAKRVAQSETDSGKVQWVEMQGASPLVDVSFLFNAGAALDPNGKKGLAAVTAAMVSDGGSAFHTIKEINDTLYPLAAGFDMQIDKEMARLAGTVHKDNIDVWYAVVAEQLFSPGWREEDLSRIKTQLVNAVRANLKDSNDEELGKEVLYSFIYGPEHAYGSYNLGAVSDLESITLEDVKAFYQAHYVPANLTVGLAGAYPDDFKSRLQADLAALPGGDSNAVALDNPPAIDGFEAVIVQKETQPVAVSFGFPIDIRRGDPDWVGLWLVRSFLGEHRSTNSHLFQRIRETRGMNYGDYTY